MFITLTKRIPSKKINKEIVKNKGVPIVCYGNKLDTMHFSVSQRELMSCIKSNTLVFDTKGDLENKQIFVQEISYHPTRGDIIHIDFLFVDSKAKIEHEISVELVGIAPGVKLNDGFVEHVLQNVEVRGRASDIPAKLDVDLSMLKEIGSHIEANDIKLPPGIELVTNPKEIVVVLTSQQKEVIEEEKESVDFSKIEVEKKKKIESDEDSE